MNQLTDVGAADFDDGPEPGGLHDALGIEAAGIGIGSPPTAAVLRDGRNLRYRHRAGWASGIAALVALPVAAVAVFGGGGGGDRVSAVGATPAAPVASDLSPAPPPPADKRGTLPDSGPPNQVDQITVLGTGTFQGHTYRLVRDRFEIGPPPPGQSTTNPPPAAHLPFTSHPAGGSRTCEAVGPQFGDRPAGTRPDFRAAVTCLPAIPGQDGSDPTYFVDYENMGVLEHDPVTGKGGPAGVFSVVRSTLNATGVDLTVGAATVPGKAFHVQGESGVYWFGLLPTDEKALTAASDKVTIVIHSLTDKLFTFRYTSTIQVPPTR